MYEGGFTYLLYRKPLLYDLAFSWSTGVEVDFYEAVFEEHAGGAEKVLELGCGTGRLMVEFAKRGYLVSGLDICFQMLRRARAKFEEQGLWNAEAYIADMCKFGARQCYDAAISALNTIGHLLTKESLRSHLECVAEALRPGGVYCIVFAPASEGRLAHTWTSAPEGVKVQCKWWRDGNRGRVVEKYLFTYRWSGGKSLILYGMMIMYAWELNEVIAAAREAGLEPVACYSDFSLGSRVELDEPCSRAILVLRRPVE